MRNGNIGNGLLSAVIIIGAVYNTQGRKRISRGSLLSCFVSGSLPTIFSRMFFFVSASLEI